jgi:hypothetical protein
MGYDQPPASAVTAGPEEPADPGYNPDEEGLFKNWVALESCVTSLKLLASQLDLVLKDRTGDLLKLGQPAVPDELRTAMQEQYFVL